MTDAQRQNTILIVEDDPDTAQLLVLQLERYGHAFEVASNGQEAILRTGETPPDLVIMDVMMPRLDGFETTRFLKAKFRNAFLPILVLTAKDDPQSRSRGVRFGCDDYLTKPYDRVDLRASVDALLVVGHAENGSIRADAAVVDAEKAEGEGADEALTAARAASEAATQAVVDSRLAVAQLLLAAGRGEHAKGHLERVLELRSGDSQASALLAQVGD
jgi:DNA-binding response OmpR family regulator